MTLFAARNISLVLMLIAFPLISLGTTGDQPALWWAGLAALGAGALIPPVLRFAPIKEKEEEEKEPPRKKDATDLGDSCRVC